MDRFWNGKKVIAYIALTHHARFISPIMEKIAGQGAKTKYIVGQAERSQEITAIKLGLDYAHIFDFVSDKDEEEIQTNYRLLRDAFSNNLKNNFLFGTSPVTVIDKTIYSTAVEYVGFKNLLKKEKPDLCFALHELHRWGKIFSFWAKKFNIPFITFQEGLYYGLDFGYKGHVQNSTLDLVWGERIKKKLVDFDAPQDKIIPVGNTHLSNEIAFQQKNQIRTKKRKQYKCDTCAVILLFFSGEVPPVQTLYPLFESVAKSQGKRLLIKFHPITNHAQVEAWVSSIPNGYKKNIKVFHDEENTYNLISMSDLCVIVQPSTTGLEALAFGKPLVHLDIKMNQKLPYSFTEFKVAVKMTPAEFGKAISENLDFSTIIKKEILKNYLKEELSETKNAIDLVVDISKKVIEASKLMPINKIKSSAKSDKEWSIILVLSNHAENVLRQLEAIALNSKNAGEFEVILIEPTQISKQISDILDTLRGDITRLATQQGISVPGMMNKASTIATGKTLVFMEKNLLPLPDWLHYLREGIRRYGRNKIFGVRIIDQRNSIVHSGMVLDENHAPVSAYRYLAAQFPEAMKERSFKMLDHFICISRTLFHETGGFWTKTGKFAFMDICLRADTNMKGKNPCIYIPNTCMIALDGDKEKFNPDDSIYFFGRWQGMLWENQETLYSTDKITREELNAALHAQSMEAANFIE